MFDIICVNEYTNTCEYMNGDEWMMEMNLTLKDSQFL